MTRLSPQQIRNYAAAPFDEIAAAAHEVRCQHMPSDQASYVIMRIVSYTNVCVADCKYCAFYRRPGDPEGYTLSNETIFAKIDELVAEGGNLVAMEGGFNPYLKIDHYEQMFRAVRDRYGFDVEIYGPTIVEVQFVAKASRISMEDALKRLWDAGLRWIPGGGAEILTDTWRKKLSPRKYAVSDYIDGMRLAQSLGYGTTATMVIGFGENMDDRIEHLEHVRKLQDETGGFSSFLLWSYQPENTAFAGAGTTNDDYLRTTALARLHLDNIPIIRASILTQGAGAAQALKCGAHDFDIPLEDQVTQQAGVTIERNVDRVLGWVRENGITPINREPLPLRQ